MVEYPLLGPLGGRPGISGRRKGADSDTVAVLEQRLDEWADQLDAAAGRPVSAESGRGGPPAGSGAALLALGGRCESGASIIAEPHRLG